MDLEPAEKFEEMAGYVSVAAELTNCWQTYYPTKDQLRRAVFDYFSDLMTNLLCNDSSITPNQGALYFAFHGLLIDEQELRGDLDAAWTTILDVPPFFRALADYDEAHGSEVYSIAMGTVFSFGKAIADAGTGAPFPLVILIYSQSILRAFADGRGISFESTHIP